MRPNCGVFEAAMKRWELLFHTVRYLKIRQLAYQVYYRVRKPRLKSSPEPVLRGGLAHWGAPNFLQPSTYDGRLFTFLGQTACLKGNWNDPALPKLWLYNLHYQDDLNVKGSESRRVLCTEMVDAWIEANPPLTGNGWEPYCLSLRIVNWVKFFRRLDSRSIPSAWLYSLTQQAEALEQQLEFHILANHLFANAKALVFVGSYLGGAQGDRWLRKGLAILDKEMPEQFLDDGAHFERSPMYQGTLLWDLADLIELSRLDQMQEVVKRSSDWTQHFLKGLKWLELMMHPDGNISFFNDATFGISPGIEDLFDYARFLGLNVSRWPQPIKLQGCLQKSSGYGIVEWPYGHRLLTDLAPVGPDYQPGHAHADTLSCELSLFGHRVLVNSGISRYGDDLERHMQRSTAAHNTVEVDQENSSEVWAGFRVGRRAKPFNVELLNSDNRVVLSGCHDGYKRLPGKVVHRRVWFAETGGLEITDELTGSFGEAIIYWHFHPNLTVEPCLGGNNCFNVRLPEGQIVVFEVDGGTVRLECGVWHPSFSVSQHNQKLLIKFTDPKITTRILWGTD